MARRSWYTILYLVAFHFTLAGNVLYSRLQRRFLVFFLRQIAYGTEERWMTAVGYSSTSFSVVFLTPIDENDSDQPSKLSIEKPSTLNNTMK